MPLDPPRPKRERAALTEAFVLAMHRYASYGNALNGDCRMQCEMLKSKLHRARVTEVALEYEGSLSIDAELMDTVGIHPYEKILAANLSNGERFETYAIPGPAGSRCIVLNGATAHKGSVGDRIIVFAFGLVPSEEVGVHRALVLTLDEDNNPTGPLREV